jgi:hypothetical protein
MFSRPYNRSSVTRPRVNQRRECSACAKVTTDCVWVRVTGLITGASIGRELCLCARCRSQQWAQGTIEQVEP